MVLRLKTSGDRRFGKGKRWRRKYRSSRAFDSTCRNHGSCAYCANGRMHKHKRQLDWGKNGIDWLDWHEE